MSTAAITLSEDDLADRLAAIRDTYARQGTSCGVCVCDGFGIRVGVERGALEVHDGIGADRRTRRYDRATHGLSRLVVLNGDGMLSLAALRWCAALGVGVLVLGADGSAHLASTPRTTDDARIRRAQALAPGQPVGLGIAQVLLGAKLRGQAALLHGRFGDDATARTIVGLAEAIEALSSEVDRQPIEDCRQLEASAAALYFGTWARRQETSPVFVTRDRARVPAHWSAFEGRRSVLASVASNRKAERPVNALLNYVFALLESEAVIACHAVGLDPGLGMVHNDAKGRPSMALDLIEPVRPEVEGFVLDLLGSRSFAKREFVETSEGHVRLMAPLTHELAETLPRWRHAIAPWAERVAHLLGDSLDGRYTPATPLTSSRARAAQAAVKARRVQAVRRAASSSPVRQRPVPGPVSLPLGCVDCGQVVTHPRRVRCDDCLSADPAQAPEVRSRRAQAIASRKRALAERSVAGLPAAADEAWYHREVLPRLTDMKLREIMSATGYSKGHCSTIRAGTWMPHVSTWPSLAKLVGVQLPGAGEKSEVDDGGSSQAPGS